MTQKIEPAERQYRIIYPDGSASGWVNCPAPTWQLVEAGHVDSIGARYEGRELIELSQSVRFGLALASLTTDEVRSELARQAEYYSRRALSKAAEAMIKLAKERM